MTSSWKRLAVWIISVISARRFWEGDANSYEESFILLSRDLLRAYDTARTIVGRIFLPPSTSKKYLCKR